MKILKESNKKLHEEEAVVETPVETTVDTEDEDIAIGDVKSASVDDVAASIQTAAEVATGGEETYSDANAKKIAQEVKTFSLGLDHAAWSPLDVQNELTESLDLCLARSMVAKKQKRRDGVDLIVTGLPGSGKTGITKQWAKDRGVNLFSLKAMNRELDAILNGFPVDTVETEDNGKQVHKVIKSRSTILDPLERPNSVLFLDEFNRAPEDLRANLLTLINEHEVEAASGQGDGGMYRFENLLFTIACINPSLPTDPGAMQLNDAEQSRYLLHMDYDSNKADALKYIPFYIRQSLDKLDKSDPDYAFLYMDLIKIYNLATYVLKHRKFRFDDREDQKVVAKEHATLLNQRELTDGLMAFGSDKKLFLWWIDHRSNFIEKNKVMFHEILDNWTPPTVTPPTDGASASPAETQTSAAPEDASDGALDYQALFNGAGGESDTGLFGNATATAASVAVSREQAAQRLADLDMTLF